MRDGVCAVAGAYMSVTHLHSPLPLRALRETHGRIISRCIYINIRAGMGERRRNRERFNFYRVVLRRCLKWTVPRIQILGRFRSLFTCRNDHLPRRCVLRASPTLLPHSPSAEWRQTPICRCRYD